MGKNVKIRTDHRFLDEAGDTTFYGKGKKIILGQPGISNTFILGLVNFKESLEPIRAKVAELQSKVCNDPYFQDIPSIQKKTKSPVDIRTSVRSS